MGMTERLLKHNVRVVAYNRSQDKVKQITRKGAVPARSIEEMVGRLPARKIIWLMLPAGLPTDAMIKQLLPLLNRGDILIDGANDFFGTAQRHAKLCARRGVHFFDCGVSGGIWGKKNGYTLMFGGPKGPFPSLEPIAQALAPRGGYGYFGEAGVGHFVKSVHNIIEYIYLEGLGEGFELLQTFPKKIDLIKVAEVWQPSSVIRSWLLDLSTTALKRPDFKKIAPRIDSVTMEELQKTILTVKGDAPAFVAAVKTRKDQSKRLMAAKRLIAATRREFGGHGVKK